MDIVPKDEDEVPIPSHTKTMAELTAALKHNAQESDKHKISNIALTNIQNQLREELSKQVELSKNGREELTRLQTEITEYENSLNLSKENEAQLKNAIVNQQKELKDQEETLTEAGNPDFDAITKLEDTMKTKLDQIGTSLTEFLLKELHENNKEIEEKMNIVMAQNRTYAESVQNTQPSGNGETVFNPKTNTDFRSIMIETRNEELAEESEKKLCSPNLILHGVNEASNNDKSEAKKADEDSKPLHRSTRDNSDNLQIRFKNR